MQSEKKMTVWGNAPEIEKTEIPENIWSYLVSLPPYIGRVQMRKTDYFEQMKLVGNTFSKLTIEAGKADWYIADDPPHARVIFFRGLVYVNRFKQKQADNIMLDYVESVIFHTLYYFSQMFPPPA